MPLIPEGTPLSTKVLSPLWPIHGSCAADGTPAPGVGSSAKTSRSMTSHAVDEEANIKLSDAEDLQRARKETMKVELQEDDVSLVWGAESGLDSTMIQQTEQHRDAADL